MRHKNLAALLYILDVFLVVDICIILFILVTGGGVYYIFGNKISIHSVGYFGYGFFLLGLLRYRLREALPFLGLSIVDTAKLPIFCKKSCLSIYDRITKCNSRQLKWLIFSIIFISFIIKLLNAYFYYGFFSGDDVEVLEMTFANLFNWDWEAWGLRSAFFPMVFIYPIQKILHTLGFVETAPLVFSGRMVVVLISCVNLILIYKIAKRESNSTAVGILAMSFLAASKLHTTFAASVLPRTVSSFFILLTIFFLLSRRNFMQQICLAAVFLGIGACIRFSEGVFIIPAVLHLVIRKRYTGALIFCVIFVVTCVLILGISDGLYWGKPFYSLIYAYNFTIVEGKSTSGFDPFYYYIEKIPLWTNIFTFGLAVLSFRLRKWHILGWGFIPIIILSILPHKEIRYMVPVIPFITLLAAISFWSFLSRIRDKIVSKGIVSYNSASAFLLLVILLGTLIFEIYGFRFRKSEQEVNIARHIAQQQTQESGAVIEQIWRVGGRLYIWKLPKIINIAPIMIHDKEYVLNQIDDKNVEWVALLDRDIRRYGYADDLERLGFQEEASASREDRVTYRLFRKPIIDNW